MTGILLLEGWLHLYFPDDFTIIEVEEQIREINTLLDSVRMSNSHFDLRLMNIHHSLTISVCHNHDNGYLAEVLLLLEKIIAIATQSYGLLYARYPDTKNYFEVFKIAKGQIYKEKDTFLSPCSEIIE